jgi:hypothetical protein
VADSALRSEEGGAKRRMRVRCCVRKMSDDWSLTHRASAETSPAPPGHPRPAGEGFIS